MAGSRLTSRSAKTPTKLLRRFFSRLNKKSKKRLIRLSVVAANLALIGAVGLATVHLPSSAASNSSPKPAQALLAAETEEEAKPLDKLASTDVAVHVARLVNLEESTAVVNKADTASAQLAVSNADDQVLSKPQIITSSLKSKKDIKNYKVLDGDTVSSIAAKFGITPDTVRFSNGLNGENVSPGAVLKISPVNGMTYTVQAGDTPDSLASKYNVPKETLVAFNDAELTGAFRVGEVIVIPDAIQPAAVRNASVGVQIRGFSWGSGPVYGGSGDYGYDRGWCTWHAAKRRAEIGNPIPKNLGNAISWLPLARKAGLPTGKTPQAGAVLYHHDIPGLGHVAFVEKVNPDGSALISDMNYPTWGKVTYRTIQPDDYGKYSFIY